jgi:hypothetical protein
MKKSTLQDGAGSMLLCGLVVLLDDDWDAARKGQA